MTFSFYKDHPDETKIWMDESNYIAVLNINNEFALQKIIEKASVKNIKFSIFREPDLDNQITAIALSPGIESKKLCANLKLALKDI